MISAGQLKAIAPGASPAIINPLAVALSGPTMAAYGIVTPLRLAHFIAQAAHETAGFKTLVEYGGDAYFNGRYGSQTRVGRKLGNTQPGDGARFRGRGIFQCTGRANYAFYGKKIGLNLIDQPALAADAAISLKIACEYWKAKGLNALADRDDVTAITEKINGGHNGLAERMAYLAKAKAVLAATGLAGAPVPPAAPVPPPTFIPPPAAPLNPADDAIVPDAPIAQEPAPNAMTSPTVLTTVGTVASSGALGVLSWVQSWYALVALAIIVAGGCFIYYRWNKQRKATGA